MPRATDEVNLSDLNTLIQDIGKTVHDQRQLLDTLEEGDAETKAKIEKMDGHIAKLLKLKSDIDISYKAMEARLGELESRRGQPGLTALADTQAQYKTAFLGFMRARGDGHAQKRGELAHKMNELAIQARQQAAAEQRAINIGNLQEGGYAVPEEIQREIERLELKFSPVRSLVRVRKVGTSDYKELVDEAGQEAAWASEMAARTETAAGTLRARTPTGGELYAYPKTTRWALEDMFFDVQQWLTEGCARAFAVKEGQSVIDGDGSDKPTGLLATTPVTTDDFGSPLRDHNAFEYFQGTGSPPTVDPDNLFDLVYGLNSAYRSNSTWVMNSLTTGVVRKLKDSNGQYHWQPGLQLGQPPLLLGYPTATWEQFPDVGAQTFPIAFGDWSRAYVLVDRAGMTVLRDEITSVGFVKFYIARRVYGTVLNNDSVKFLRCP